MKFCPNCGSEITEQLKFCPNCGNSLSVETTQKQQTASEPAQQPVVIIQPPIKKKNSGLGITSFILSLTIILAPIALILSIIALITSKGKKKGLAIAALIISGLVCLVVFGATKASSSSTSNNQHESVSQSLTNTTKSPSNSGSSSSSSASHNTPVKETEKELFTVSLKSTGMKLGEIGKDKSFYVSVLGVRSSDKLETAINNYSEDIPAGKEVLYVFVEAYNNSKKTASYSRDNISVYADSVQAEKPDTNFLVGIDGYKAMSSYKMDAGRKAMVLKAVVVNKGWQELTVFANDLSWKVTPEEVSKEFSYKTVLDIKDASPVNKEGEIVYSGKYELVYDGFEFYTYTNMFSGDKVYAVFKYTLKNKGESTIDYNMVGYSMRGYINNRLIDDASYTLNDTVSGYTNVFDVDEIKPGMSSKLYIAFELETAEITNVTTFESVSMTYDAGYITSEVLATVRAK